MKLLRNTGADRVIDVVGPGLGPGNQLDVVSPTLSLFAFAEVIGELPKLSKARLLLPANGSELALLGSGADRAARNRLQSRWLAKQCAKWLEDKSSCARRAIPSRREP